VRGANRSHSTASPADGVAGAGSWVDAAARDGKQQHLVGGFLLPTAAAASRTARLIRSSSTPHRTAVVLLAWYVPVCVCVRGVITVITSCRAGGESYSGRSSSSTVPRISRLTRALDYRRHTAPPVVRSVRRLHVALRRRRRQEQQPIRRLPRFDWVTRAHTRTVGRRSVCRPVVDCTRSTSSDRYVSVSRRRQRTGPLCLAKNTSPGNLHLPTKKPVPPPPQT